MSQKVLRLIVINCFQTKSATRIAGLACTEIILHFVLNFISVSRDPDDPPPERSNPDEFNEILTPKRRKIGPKALPRDPKQMKKAINKDLRHYEATGNRSDSLELLRNALSAIPPTSCEAEVSSRKHKICWHSQHHVC